MGGARPAAMPLGLYLQGVLGEVEGGVRDDTTVEFLQAPEAHIIRLKGLVRNVTGTAA